MKYIISGTNRPNSRTLEVSKIIQNLYKELGEKTEIIDLKDLQLEQLSGSDYSNANLPPMLAEAIEKTTTADGMIIVCPEYNGSYPGILKYFIDHWKYPESFEFRPICLVGLGGRFGGVRPVEHLQQVFGYRNAYIYPLRVFITDVWRCLQDGQIQDPQLMQLLRDQAAGFGKFVQALQAAKIDANSIV